MKKLLSVFALALLAQASPAIAQPETRTVSYADLDLSKSEGRATLERRLRTAVRNVCDGPGIVNLKEMYARRVCRRDTLAQAEADMTLAIRKHATVRVAKVAAPHN